jgi:hypothetical protein
MPAPLLFHVDCNFLNLRVEYLRGWLDRLAALGYTGIVWELEDKVRWESCPECVWPEAMSKATFRALLDYARARGLENIPLLQTIGHAEYVLSHPAYFAWRENPEAKDCYCTSHPAVRQFLRRWIEEYLDLFGELRQFHLGGDEAYEFGKCPVCAARAGQVGRNGLYAEHLRDIAQPILARGVRPGIWCDMVLAHPSELAAIPPEFVIWDWNYWDQHQPTAQGRVWGKGLLRADQVPAELRATVPELLDAEGRFVPFYTSDFLRRLGRDVIVSSSSRSHGDGLFAGRHEVHAPNIVGAAQKAERAGLQGHCVTSWAIRAHPWETQAAWLALAAAAHRQPELPYAQLQDQVAEQLYGLPGRELFAAFAAIGTPVPFAARNETGFQWSAYKVPELPPPGHVARVLERWRGHEGGALYRQRREEATAAATTVAAGLAQLQALVPRARRGLVDLEAWTRAGHHQLWSARLAQELFAKAEGTPPAMAEVRALLGRLQSGYRAWLEKACTPQSAALLASLAYAPLAEYLAAP